MMDGCARFGLPRLLPKDDQCNLLYREICRYRVVRCDGRRQPRTADDDLVGPNDKLVGPNDKLVPVNDELAILRPRGLPSSQIDVVLVGIYELFVGAYEFVAEGSELFVGWQVTSYRATVPPAPRCRPRHGAARATVPPAPQCRLRHSAARATTSLAL